MPIRFENLPNLLNSMRRLGWTIDTFALDFNNVYCIVLLTILSERVQFPQTEIIQKKKHHLKVKLEFISNEDKSSLQSIVAFADFYNVYFEHPAEFYKFFNIN